MSMTPPRMTKRPHVTEIHGYTLVDDYFWFRDKSNPEVLEHLHRENAYTHEQLKPVTDLQNLLFEEMKGRVPGSESDYPYRRGEYFYYSRISDGQEYRVYCRRRGSVDGPEEILLDVNELARDKNYLRLAAFRVSPDHNWLAYTIDDDGSEKCKLHIKNLKTGEVLPEVITDAYYDVEWAEDSAHFFFNRLNDRLRPDRVFRQRRGEPAHAAVEIFHEPDPEYFVGLAKSRSDEFIFIHCAGKITTEIHRLPAREPLAGPRVILPRRVGVEYDVEHGRPGVFYILTNDQARNFRLVEAPIEDPRRENWTDIIAHNPDIYLRSVDAFKDFFVVFERQDGLPHLRVVDQVTRDSHRVALPESNYTLGGLENAEMDTPFYRFFYASLTTPGTTYDYDVAARRLIVRKEREIPNFDKSQYATERVFARSHDGVEVPVSLLYRKDLRRDGSAPCYLYGYGSYGGSMPPSFRATIFSLVDRGFIFAIAHVRGGSEMGRHWYEDGKFLKKKNTFFDFIATAEMLIASGYTRSGEITISGGSAGGMLVGTCANIRPELFKAVVASVPFVDVINTMLDDTLPLTALEYEEWGNPKDKTYFDYMLSYSPYDNVEAKAYPHMFVTGGLNDPRVTYWEPSKWVAKLRDKKTNDSLVLLHMNMDAGHSGKSGRFEALKEYAMEFAFVLLVHGRSGTTSAGRLISTV